MGQQGSDSLNVNVGAIATGEVVVKADTKELVNLQRELKKTVEVMNTLVQGKDVAKYFDEEAASIESVIRAAEKFSKIKSNGNAEELVATMNAFSAWHPDDKIENYFEDIARVAGKSIAEIKEMGKGLDSAFSVSNLEKAVDVYQRLTKASSESGTVIERLRQGDPSALTERIKSLSRELEWAEDRASRLEEKVNEFETGERFAELEDQVSQFEETAERAQKEFQAFLSMVGYAGRDIDPENKWGDFYSYFEQIKEGALTAKEAIAEFRKAHAGEFKDVIEADQFAGVLSELEKIGSALDDIADKVSDIGDKKPTGGVSDALKEGEGSARKMSEALGQTTEQINAMKGIVDVLLEIVKKEDDVGESAVSAKASVTQMLEALSSFGSSGAEAISKVNDVLKGIQTLNGLSIGSKTIENITNMLNTLGTTPQIDGNILSQLSRLNFQGLADLKVSKAALSNLATFLPEITSVNMDALEKLSVIRWDNLSQLNVSKAAVSNLKELADAMGGKPLSIDGAKISIDEASLTNLSKAIEDSIQRASQNIKLVINHAELSAEAQREIAKGAEAAAADTKTATGQTGSGRKKQTDDETAAIEKQTDAAWKNYEAWKRMQEEKARAEGWKAADALAKEEARIERETAQMQHSADVAEETARRKAAAAEKVAQAEEAAAEALGDEDDGGPKLNEYINLYLRLYDALKKVENAKREGNNANIAEFSQRASDIEAQIELLAEENRELDELAQQDARVIKVADALKELENRNAAKAVEETAQKIKDEAAAAEAAALKIKELSSDLQNLQISGAGSGIKFEGNEEFVKRYSAAIEEAREAIDRAATASDEDRQRFVNAAEEKIAAVAGLKKELNELASAQQQAANLANKIDLWKESNPKAYSDVSHQIDNILNKLKSGMPLSAAEVRNLSNEFTNLSAQEKLAGNTGKTFFQQLQAGWRKFGGWSLVSRSFMSVIRVFKQAVTAVKDVDAAMTELKKVTDLTKQSYDKLYDSMTKMASSVGSKLSDVINSVADFSRLGFGAEEALSLSEAALVYFNVGDGIEDISVATESLISTIKAFGISAEDAMSIVDKFNEVGN